jgi:hypothetical protein
MEEGCHALGGGGSSLELEEDEKEAVDGKRQLIKSAYRIRTDAPGITRV